MNQICFISPIMAHTVLGGVVVRQMRMEPNNKGGVAAADAVYTNAPTQPQDLLVFGQSMKRGKRNTYGVRTNG